LGLPACGCDFQLTGKAAWQCGENLPAGALLSADELDPQRPERDHDAERRESLERWEAAAPGWGRQLASWGDTTAAVAAWMIDAAALAPGQRALDLAAGPGELGFIAARLIEPGGELICSDQSEAMLELARARGAELGLTNVSYRVLGGEWIDLELASLDVVLCRWGYMLMVDPAAALRETRRVLRSGGRVSLAVWDAAEHNPWLQVPLELLLEHGIASAPEQDSAGTFALGDAALVRSLLEEAGFTEITVETVEIVREAPEFDSWWASHLDLSISTRTAFEQADEAQTEQIEAELAARLAPYTAPDGALAVPGRTLVAVAEA
jgi:ubiquinone/menaquinone biosynthesis C-methylase UbiE